MMVDWISRADAASLSAPACIHALMETTIAPVLEQTKGRTYDQKSKNPRYYRVDAGYVPGGAGHDYCRDGDAEYCRQVGWH